MPANARAQAIRQRMGIPRPVADTRSLPAPTGGWNARDSLGNMAPQDAVILTNFFPGTSDVLVRFGSVAYATGIGSQVETLMTYSGGSALKLYAVAANGKTYNVSSSGTAMVSASGLSNGRMQFVNITTSAASYLAAVNGANKTRYYTGSAWAVDGDGAPYDVTGLDTSTCSDIMVHKGRVWYAVENTLKTYYLATGSLGGAATAFDLSSVAVLGGYIVAIDTWTIDAGYGVDDLWVAVTNNGEVIVYRGTDPASSASWALVGIWHVGQPIGNNCLMKYAGDLLIICQDGVLPLSAALQSSRVNPKVALSNKIQWAISNAVTSYGSNFGWSLFYYPKQNQLYVNVPVSEGSNQQQYVMNTITKAWCNFTGWAANCWELYNNQAYFGGNGTVYKAWSSNSDDGIAINSDGLQAFNYFKMPGAQKRCSMIRPVFNTNGNISVYANAAADFNTIDTTTPIGTVSVTAGVWDTSVWDSGLWGSDLTVYKAWLGANSIGYALAPRVKVQSRGVEVSWISTDMVMERGGTL